MEGVVPLYSPKIDEGNDLYPCIAHGFFNHLVNVYDMPHVEIHYLRYKKALDSFIAIFNSYYKLPDDEHAVKWFNDLLSIVNKFSHPIDLEIIFDPIIREYLGIKNNQQEINLKNIRVLLRKLGIRLIVEEKLPVEQNMIDVVLKRVDKNSTKHWQVELDDKQHEEFKKSKDKYALFFDIYHGGKDIDESLRYKKVAELIYSMMYKHHSEQCGLANFKKNIALAQKRLAKEHKFLLRLRIVEARLERHKEEYISLGMTQDNFKSLFQSIDVVTKISQENIEMLSKVEECAEILENTDDPQTIKVSFYKERLYIEERLANFLSVEHVELLKNRFIEAMDTHFLVKILPEEVLSKDKEWSMQVNDKNDKIKLEEVLLPNVCESIAAHMVDYYELCEELKEHGFKVNIQQLQDAVVAVDNAYSSKMQYIDKLNLDKDVGELITTLRKHFYDRGKHKVFLQKRDKVVDDIFIYIRNHHLELDDTNLKELTSLIVDLFVENEISKLKLDAMIVFGGNFVKTFIKLLHKSLQKNFAKGEAKNLEKTILESVAEKLSIKVDVLSKKPGKKVILSLAKKELDNFK